MTRLLDPCPDCGKPMTELTAGATVVHCWFCSDRAASHAEPHRVPSFPDPEHLP